MPKLYSAAASLKPAQVLKLTPAEAAKGKGLNAFKKLPQGDDLIVEFVATCLLKTTALVKCDADGESLALWAELIAGSYGHLKPTQILKAMLEGAGGRYGKTYGAVTYQDVTSWLDHYEAQELTRAETEALRNKEGYDDDRQSLKDTRDPLTIKDLKDLTKINPSKK